MIRLTSFADYAVVLMSELAKEKDRKASAQELAVITGIPGPTASKILNALGQGKLLRSHRGLKGGFALARPAEEITIAEIIEIIDGPICITECADNTDNNSCSFSDACTIKPHWPPINNAIKAALSAITLAYISKNGI